GPLRTARVLRLVVSSPESGSDTPNATFIRPPMTSGRFSALRRSDPCLTTTLVPNTFMCTAEAAVWPPPRTSSSHRPQPAGWTAGPRTGRTRRGRTRCWSWFLLGGRGRRAAAGRWTGAFRTCAAMWAVVVPHVVAGAGRCGRSQGSDEYHEQVDRHARHDENRVTGPTPAGVFLNHQQQSQERARDAGEPQCVEPAAPNRRYRRHQDRGRDDCEHPDRQVDDALELLEKIAAGQLEEDEAVEVLRARYQR